MMDFLYKISPLIILFILVLLFQKNTYPREYYKKVKIKDISNYNGRPVKVSGDLVEIKARNVDDGYVFVDAKLTDGTAKVSVFADFHLVGIAGEKTTIHGVYHRLGSFGGMLSDNYIIADKINNNWE